MSPLMLLAAAAALGSHPHVIRAVYRPADQALTWTTQQYKNDTKPEVPAGLDLRAWEIVFSARLMTGEGESRSFAAKEATVIGGAFDAFVKFLEEKLTESTAVEKVVWDVTKQTVAIHAGEKVWLLDVEKEDTTVAPEVLDAIFIFSGEVVVRYGQESTAWWDEGNGKPVNPRNRAHVLKEILAG